MKKHQLAAQAEQETNKKTLLKILRNYLIDSNKAFNKKTINQIADFLYDISCTSIIFEFYKSHQTTLSKFLKQFKIDDFLKNYTWICKIFEELPNSITKDAELLNIKDLSSITPLGDVHSIGATKYHQNKRVITSDYPCDYKLISELSSNLRDDEITTLFPYFSKLKTGIQARKYLPINNNFSNKKDLKEFYKSYGKAMTYILLFRSIDNYYENMIISNNHPMFFDHECFFTNILQNESNKPFSFEHTGTLNNNRIHDTSSLTGGLQPVKSLLRPTISGSNKSPKIFWERDKNISLNHIPKYNNSVVDPYIYTREVINGITQTKNFIINHLKEITTITEAAETFTRVIIRPTAIYKAILINYSYEYLQGNKEIKAFIINELENHEPLLKLYYNKDLIEYEADTLLSGKIPIFFQEIHKKEILTPDNKVIAKFTKSSFEIWLNYLPSFDEVVNNAIKKLESLH